MGSKRLRRLVAYFAIAGLLATAMPSSALAASSSPSIGAASAILIASDGTVLWSKKADDRRAVASTIKLLNALVVLDHASLDDTVTVSHKAVAAVDEGGVELYTGQKLTVRQLMTIMLVRSANDAAEVLAVDVAGSESKFVAMMNAKAKSLGLTGVRAVDPHGLGDRTRCSAASLAVIARELMTYPEVRKMVTKKSVKVPIRGGRSVRYSATNQLLGHYAGIEGIKTGFTDPAGYCFVGMAKRGDTELIGVVLGADDGGARFTEMARLLDWGFSHYATRKLLTDRKPIGVVAVGASGEATVSVRAAEPYSVLEPIGGPQATVRISLPTTVTQSVWRGEELGRAEVVRAGSVVATIPLVAEAAVSDPAQVRAEPLRVAPPTSAEKPAPGLWERLIQSLQRAMGRLSLVFSGTPPSGARRSAGLPAAEVATSCELGLRGG